MVFIREHAWALLLVLQLCGLIAAAAHPDDSCASDHPNPQAPAAPEDVVYLMQMGVRTAQRRGWGEVLGGASVLSGEGGFVNVTLVGASGVMANLAAHMEENGTMDMFSVKTFAEKILKTKQLIKANTSCGMLGEEGSSCEAPNADEDASGVTAKPCCFEWLIDGVSMDGVPALWHKPPGALSISVSIPSQAAFEPDLAKFLQDLPITPSTRKKFASKLWASGITKEKQLGGIDAKAISAELTLSSAVASMLSHKVDKIQNKDESQYTTLQIIRASGLFRGVTKMDNLEAVMLSPAVRLSTQMAEKNNDELSFAVAYTPDSQSREVSIEATSSSKFASLNKAIEIAGFSAAAIEASRLGFGVSIDGQSQEMSLQSDGEYSSALASKSASFDKSLYFFEPRVLLEMEPSMLEPTAGFHEALDSIMSGSLSPERMFELYGTHTCPRALLGGWMRYTGNYRTPADESTMDMAKSVSLGVNDYMSNKVAASTSDSGNPASTNASLLSLDFGLETTVSDVQGDLNLMQDWKGGSGSSVLPEWRESLRAKLNPNWRVIDRYQEKCIPHWYWVADNPNLAHTLCLSYAKMRNKTLVPYVLEHPSVACGASKVVTKALASTQPSLKACAEHVYATHGKAYFVYSSRVNWTQLSADAAVGGAFGNTANNDASDGAFPDKSHGTPVGYSLLEASNKKCVVLESLDGCKTTSDPTADLSIYKAQGLGNICGAPPPGYTALATKSACPTNQYQAKDGYPGKTCVGCFLGCAAGTYLKGCGAALPGSCVKCPKCPAGFYRVNCGVMSVGSCVACNKPTGPFRNFTDECKFDCYPPAEPDGQTCGSPKCDGKDCQMAEKNDTSLVLGTCNTTQWNNTVLTEEAHCEDVNGVDKFSGFRVKLEWIGEGENGKGQWYIKNSVTEARLSLVNKTLLVDSNASGFDRFTFVKGENKSYEIFVAETEECVKAVIKPGFQLSKCCCDKFQFK